MLLRFLFIGIGGALGAILRHSLTMLCQTCHIPTTLGTLLTNIIGSFLMGLLVSSCQPGAWLLMATVGLCGGFTTFSTFSLQSVKLLQQGHYLSASLYMFGTLALCIAFTILGCYIGHKHSAIPL